jgi:hypothetical protein
MTPKQILQMIKDKGATSVDLKFSRTCWGAMAAFQHADQQIPGRIALR